MVVGSNRWTSFRQYMGIYNNLTNASTGNGCLTDGDILSKTCSSLSMKENSLYKAQTERCKLYASVGALSMISLCLNKCQTIVRANFASVGPIRTAHIFVVKLAPVGCTYCIGLSVNASIFSLKVFAPVDLYRQTSFIGIQYNWNTTSMF